MTPPPEGYLKKIEERMAESAVTFLLNQLTLLLCKEAKLLGGGIREEVECIRDELERVRAFLRVADAKEETDPELQVWVKQVREVAYDTEDVHDEFMLHLAHHQGDGFYGFLFRMSCSIRNLKARNRIASEIRRIKYRVSNIAEGHQRYRYKFSLSEQGSNSSIINNAWYDRRGDALLLEEAELVGFDKPRKQLIEWLVEDNRKLKVVSVVGMGGLGKTTLVKRVYEDVKVKRIFQNHAWITVSQSFELRELLEDLIQQLFDEIRQPVPQRVETMDNNKLKALIKDFLHQSRYVLVLDDVWSINAWDVFKYALPNNNRGSRVLLTTRIVNVASTSCVESHGNIYTMNALSPEDSWTLFCRKTFQENYCPPHLEGLSRSILGKCEGLPLAIVAISGVLATKDMSGMHEWEMVHRSLCDELEGNDKFESMKRILSLSYNDLPYYLKICFLYFCIFPEDYHIKSMNLVRLWTAEGFVEVRAGKTTEEAAEGYLNELVNRSLVQVADTTEDGRPKIIRIHDLLREITISKSREQNIVTIASEGNTWWPEKVRRLSIHYTLGNVQESKSFSQLRSLLMFGVAEHLSKSTVQILFNGGVRLLKVLDLRGASLETLPDAVVKLFHLRYLSLRRTKIKMLPNSIGKLENLQTLDIKHAYVTELPIQILKLQRLRHLLVYGYNIKEGYLHFIDGFKTLARIGGLSSLQKLCYIEANHGDGGIIAEELGRLTQLRRLGIVKLRSQDGLALCSSIDKLSNLRSLTVGSFDEDEIINIQSLSSPPKFLERLYLDGRLEKSPHWFSSLHNLVKVKLRWSKLRDDPLPYLQDLPNLVEIELFQAYEREELCFKCGGFQKLKILWLLSLKGLSRVTVEEGAMPFLEQLYFRECELLEEVPSGIEHLTNLKILELVDMPHKLVMKLNQDRQGSTCISFYQNREWSAGVGKSCIVECSINFFNSFPHSLSDLLDSIIVGVASECQCIARLGLDRHLDEEEEKLRLSARAMVANPSDGGEANSKHAVDIFGQTHAPVANEYSSA
ncbi:disease resistance protein RPM1-like [Cornus florida]|uniref:disease resistance protein RPM1-like n=1 Tax=Cornus florida TaxID=4283 RepID=UPI00289B1AE7|nr:disease resistance protein RPM1-like [Cornus florida]